MSYREFAALGAVAEAQHGLVSTAQAARVGVARTVLSRMAAAGALVRVARGVYRVSGAPEPEHEEIRATLLALGCDHEDDAPVPAAVVAGQTAAVIHDIGDFLPNRMYFITRAPRMTRNPAVRLSSRPLEPLDVTVVDGVPVLTVEATIADLIMRGADLSLVGDAVADAKAEKKLRSDQALRTVLAPLTGSLGLADGDADELMGLLSTHNSAVAA